MKTLIITDCSKVGMWYQNNIGKEYPYLGDEENFYWSKEDAGWKNIVLKSDAKIKDE